MHLFKSEDWLAVWMGVGLLLLTPFLPTFPKFPTWSSDVFHFYSSAKLTDVGIVFVLFTFLFFLAGRALNTSSKNILFTLITLFALTLLVQILSAFELAKAYGFGYAFWALFIGLFISNVFTLPDWLQKTLNAELFVKTGLVLLGAEILFSKMAILGLPALFVAWFVTPIVIVFMYYLGTRVLKLGDKLSIVIATATSVCGVSAAIACSAACRAKKEELTLAVSMTLIFTVVMMVAMPALIKLMGMDPLIGGAWIGGTIDATGAVVAAGAVLGDEAMNVAAIVKMVQNIMVGVVALVVAIIWAGHMSKPEVGKRVSYATVWERFPKFILGFVGASLVFSFIIFPLYGESVVKELTDVSKSYRGLLFTLAFLAIGLESNFKHLAKYVEGGKPIWLYIAGQSFNIVLTLIAAYLAFGGILFELPSE